jgi:hypothetical protein
LRVPDLAVLAVVRPRAVFRQLVAARHRRYRRRWGN